MKWLKKTARGFSPGNACKPTPALKGPPNGLGATHDGLTNYASRSPFSSFIPPPLNAADRQGGHLFAAYPGLKPLAVLWDHFVAGVGNYPTLSTQPHYVPGSARRSAQHRAEPLRAQISAPAPGQSGASPYHERYR